MEWKGEVKKREKAIVMMLLLLFLIPGFILGQSAGGDQYHRGEITYTHNDSLKQDTLKVDSLVRHLHPNHPRSLLINRPMMLSVKYTGGRVLPSSDPVRGDNAIPYAQYAEAKLGFSVLGNRWKDIAYGMPYYGIGVGVYDFNRKDFGHPISAYLYQGALLYEFSQALQLKYEWNFGVSFNWNTYDPVTNPRNESVSAPVNVYFAGNLYLNWVLSQYWDLNVGLSINHVSNGATKMPNSGLNTLGTYIGLTYNFDRERIMREYNPFLVVPEFRTRFVSDITVHATKRQRKLPTSETGLSSSYINHNFFVMGVSYGLLYMPGYKYRYGIGLDGIYDESADFTAQKVGETEKGDDIVKVLYGKTRNRFALGVSLRGEIVMPKYIVSGEMGYDVIHNNRYDKRFYQGFSVKVPFWNDLYGSFTLRTKGMSKAQYILFGVGYVIEHKAKKKG